MNLPILKIKFVDFWSSFDENANFFIEILAKKYKIVVDNDPDILFYSCFGDDFLNYSCLRVFYTGENVRPNFLDCDYALSFDYDYINSHRHYRLPLCAIYHYKYFYPPGTAREFNSKLVNRGFCSFLYSNNTSKIRKLFFQQLSNYKQVDSGGKVFNNIDNLVKPKDTMSFLSQYKFNIAFENTEHLGYTTEKLYNALLANTVPIYWGNPLVIKDFNAKAFINVYDFDNFDSLIKYIVKVDGDDELYLNYLREPTFKNGVDNKFINSDNLLSFFDNIIADKDKHYAVNKDKKTAVKIKKYLAKKINRLAESINRKV